MTGSEERFRAGLAVTNAVAVLDAINAYASSIDTGPAMLADLPDWIERLRADLDALAGTLR